MSANMLRSYRVAADGRTVVCDAIVARSDGEALAEAVAWRRDELSRLELHDVDGVLALRALMTIDDLLTAPRPDEDHLPLTVDRKQVTTLCEIAGAYVSERDVGNYQPPEERDRIERLRGLAGPLMDCSSELAAAERELRDRALPV
jgi:hypothetical protein